MSHNTCLDPRVYYNLQTLSCDPAEPAPPAVAQATAEPENLSRPRASEGVQARTPRSMEDFRNLILQRAAVGAPSLGKGSQKFNPQFFSLLSYMPLGCGSAGDSEDLFAGTSGAGAPGSGGSSPITTGGTGAGMPAGGSAGSGGSGGREGDIDAGGEGEAAIPGAGVLHDTALCGSDGTIPDLDQGAGVCANYTDNQHELFSWNPEQPGQIETLLSLGFAPDQVLKSSEHQYFITHHGDALANPPQLGGLAMVDVEQGIQSQMSFTRIVLGSAAATSSGSVVTEFNPTFPKGLAQIGDKIFIATSNLVTRALPIENYFNPGTVLLFDAAAENWVHYITTSRFNPTSLAVINGKLMVVNSGDINPARNAGQMVTTPSSIDIIDPNTLQIEKTIALHLAADGGAENLAAGINGEIAVSPDGKTLVLPTGDNSGRILVVDLESETIKAIQIAGGQKVLLTGITFHPSAPLLYVANFNDGKLYTVDLNREQVVDEKVLDEATADFSGISDGLWQSASVFMGVGPQIYRLPLSQ